MCHRRRSDETPYRKLYLADYVGKLKIFAALLWVNTLIILYLKFKSN